MASNWTIDRRTFRVYDSPIERADALRRQLSRLIVGCAEYRPDPLVVRRDGFEILRRKPTHAETQGIAQLTEEYGRRARQLPNRRPANPEIEELMLQRDLWQNGGSKADIPANRYRDKWSHEKDDATGTESRNSAVLEPAEVHIGVRPVVVDPIIDPSEADFLARGGWRIFDLPTGNPDGRPPLSTEAEARKQLAEVAPLPDQHRAIRARKHRTSEQTRLYRATANTLRSRQISPKHAARSLSVSPRTIYNMKSDQSGDAEVFEVLEEMRGLMKENREDNAETRRVMRETAQLLRERFPSNEDVGAALDLFIAGLPTD